MAQIDFASMNLTQLLAARSQIDADIAMKTGGAVAGTSVTKTGKIRKTPKNAGKPTAYGDFSSKIQKEHAEEIKAFKAANPEIKGAHFSYVGTYKKEHEDEYKAFLAEWEAAHPKDAESAEEEKDEEKSQTSSQKRRGPKKLTEMTPEELAKHKEAVAARKAKKEATVSSESVSDAAPVKKAKKVAKKEAAIVTPVAVVATEDEDPELLPFKHKGKNYLRLGTKREDGNHLWTSGNIWESKKGAKGAYVGCLQADGTIDPDEELEPIIE